MLFGNGLSALMTLLGISAALVVLFVIGPLVLAGRGQARPRGWLAWLVYFGALGAGFMLIEVSVLQRFVLLLGHPGLLADGDAVLAAARHRPRRGVEPAASTPRSLRAQRRDRHR